MTRDGAELRGAGMATRLRTIAPVAPFRLEYRETIRSAYASSELQPEILLREFAGRTRNSEGINFFKTYLDLRRVFGVSSSRTVVPHFR